MVSNAAIAAKQSRREHACTREGMALTGST